MITKTCRISLRLYPDDLERWKRQAKRERRSLASLIEVALTEYLERHATPADVKPA